MAFLSTTLQKLESDWEMQWFNHSNWYTPLTEMIRWLDHSIWYTPHVEVYEIL